MKFFGMLKRKWDMRSPPSRGAWIEMSPSMASIICCPVAPLAGGVD